MQPVPFINRVRLTNYKSIARCDAGLSPLTVLIGPNGSGKSNFIDALSFLAYALQTSLATAIDDRGGLPQLVRRVPVATDSFSIEVNLTLTWESQLVTGSYGFEVSRRDGTSFGVISETCELSWSGAVGRWHREGSTVRDGLGSPVAQVEHDRLYLPIAGSQLPVGGLGPSRPTTFIPTPFSAVNRALANMRFYSLGLTELRELGPISPGAVLGHGGRHLADVFGDLERSAPGHKSRLDSYLSAVLRTAMPDGVQANQWYRGDLDKRGVTMIQLKSPVGYDHREMAFGPYEMSDGTIRAAGVLAALFQSAALDGRIPLVGIEEPETGLHPAAMSVLFDALTEASEHVQVIATSQSADLLDRDDLDVSAIRSVTMNEGVTLIAGVDAASREIVTSRLYTLGELMRGNQISPEPTPDASDAESGF